MQNCSQPSRGVLQKCINNIKNTFILSYTDKILKFHCNSNILILEVSSGKILNCSKSMIEFYGYDINKLKELSISDLDVLPKDEVLSNLQKLIDNSLKSISCKHRCGDGKIKYVRLSAKILSKNVAYCGIEDMTEYRLKIHKASSQLSLLNSVLRGIPDIIGVYTTENLVMFYNDSGYHFFNKMPQQVKGKKCYEILGRNEKCTTCGIDRAISGKKIIRYERYIPELGKYVDCCYNPILDENGEVSFVIEQLRDITERKLLEKKLKESEERYRKIVDLSPDGIVIICENKVVLANRKIVNLFNDSYNEIIGQDVYKYMCTDFIDILNKRVAQLLKMGENDRSLFDYRVKKKDNSIIDIEVSATYLNYKGKPAIQAVIRDITKRKRELNRAAEIQKESLQKFFPLEDKVDIEVTYVPARTVSGDFYNIHKVNEDEIIGVLFDVSGKGLSASLSISAFNVLFQETILHNNDPLKILHELNKKSEKYLKDNFIAACCFKLNFKNKQAKIAGAGINEFATYINGNCEEVLIKGPFLGMFEDSIFDEKVINFNSGDRFYIFSDGLDFIFTDKEFTQNYLKKHSLTEINNYMNNYLNDRLSDVDGLKDDCTLISMEIK